MTTETLKVTSNVARDLLQSAGLFQTPAKVVWEYVSNSLQYVESGVTPEVWVHVEDSKKKITIRDNGRGMNLEGLNNYFQMHAQNIDKLSGKSGRGKFGTGKSAAFGIANRLEIESCFDGTVYRAKLNRAMIEANIESGEEFEVDLTTLPKTVDDENYTQVTISEIQLKKFDRVSIKNEIERHLSQWPGEPIVYLNQSKCVPKQHSVANTWSYEVDEDEFPLLKGSTELKIEETMSPLDKVQRGIQIYGGGWVGSESADLDNQPRMEYITGSMTIPAIDDESISSISAFDSSRSGILNRENPVVEQLVAFIGPRLHQVRKELASRYKKLKEAENAKQLQKEADLIAQMINDDFAAYSDDLKQMLSISGIGKDLRETTEKSEDGKYLHPDKDGEPGLLTEILGGSSGGEGSGGGGGGDLGEVLEKDPVGDLTGKPATKKQQKKRAGGFSLEFENHSEIENRALYLRDRRSISINLDHPIVKGLHDKHGSDSRIFLQFAHELAFNEYAMAMAEELESVMDKGDVIYHVRDTLDRLSRIASKALFSEEG